MQITVSRECRINTGNYEGTTYFANCTMTDDEIAETGLGASEVIAHLGEVVENAMVEQLERGHNARGQRPTRVQIAKRHALGLATNLGN